MSVLHSRSHTLCSTKFGRCWSVAFAVVLHAAALVPSVVAQPGTTTKDGSAEGSVQPRPEPGAGVPDLSPLVHEGVLNAPVGEVWKVFSTAEGFKKFGVAQCEMDFRIGGLIRSHYSAKGVIGDEGTIVNRILAFEPGRMIAFQIDTPPKGFPFMQAYTSTWSVATLTDLGDGRTHLRLAGHGYTADKESQEMRAFFKNGNQWSMKKLQSSFDSSSAPKPAQDAHAPESLGIIEHVSVVHAPASVVYERMSTSAGWTKFFGVESRIEPTPGGKFEIEFDPSAPAGKRGSEGCTVLSVDPGRMLSFSWNAPPKFEFVREQRTWVVVSFEELGTSTTRVRLRHMGFAELATAHPAHKDECAQVRAYFERAWGFVLAKLAESWKSE
jgi:uncharacterized protein YndB with AHSA1/START domain